MPTEHGLILDELVIGPYGTQLLRTTTRAIARGSSLALLGDAGSGKSTVLTTIAGRRPPLSGSVRFDGAGRYAARTGYADQQHHLPDALTAAEHLMVPLLAQGRHPDDWSGIESLLTRLGLPRSAHHNLLEELSGGQQQRVAIARALIGDPPLICLDDPVSELDTASADLVWTALRTAQGEGAVVVLATPRPEDADRLDHTLQLG